MRKKHVAVLMGGFSSERPVSLSSGTACADALEAEPEIGHAARADIIATFDRDPACHRYVDPLLYFKGYQSMQAHRMAHRLWHLGRKDFAYYLQAISGWVRPW